MDKNQRQNALLRAIIHEYIKTAHPVSSKILVEKCGFPCSSATIRNDMAELEEAGLIAQPHTSAGRIPTEIGYQYYIRHFLHPADLTETNKETLKDAFRTHVPDERQRTKRVAKTLANITQEAVVVSFANGDVVYTGMSYMFRQPEFTEANSMLAVSEAFDRLDEVMHSIHEHLEQNVHEEVADDIQVLMGKDNPFSQNCSLIVSEYEFDNTEKGTLGILGPMRMDYDMNIAILEYMESLLTQYEKEQ